jgi:hypothetical protein
VDAEAAVQSGVLRNVPNRAHRPYRLRGSNRNQIRGVQWPSR